MASTNDHNGISASPNSSEEVESHHGTPATKLSPFSPDEIREDPKVIGQGIVRSKVPPAFVLTLAQSNFNSHGKVGNAAISGSQDPFISAPTLTSTTRSSNDASKLSPNASAFTPTSLVESVSSNSTSFAFEAPLSAPICGNRLSNFASLGLHPIQKVSQNGTPGKNTVLDHSNNASFSPTSLPTGSSLSSPVAIAGALKLGHFSTDIGKSRYLIISNLGQVSITKEIETFLLVSFHNFDAWKVIDRG